MARNDWACALSDLSLAACGPGTSPKADPHAVALSLARQVSSGAIHDCEALARFAEAAGTGNAEGLLEAFNPFIPREKANYPLGWPIGLTGVERPVKLEGAVSGYRAEFRKGHEPGRLAGTNHDQAHHFARYFILGARVPRPVALRFLGAAERPESWEDLNLGREASWEAWLPSYSGQACAGRIGRGDSGALVRVTAAMRAHPYQIHGGLDIASSLAAVFLRPPLETSFAAISGLLVSLELAGVGFGGR